MTGFGRNFLPGPTDIHPEVMAALQGPMFSHRAPKMQALMAEVQPSLQECFGTRQPVFTSTSSATGLIEAAIRNGVRERVLVGVGGYFGEYFARVAEACGKQAIRVHVHPGEVLTPERLDQFLEGPAVDAVALVHSESSTGALADIQALARVVRARKDILLLVDGVTAIGAMPIELDRWGVDYYCTGSQKAMALPPGLAFGAASERFQDRAQAQRDAGFYFSIRKLVSITRENLPFWTPAVSLLYALQCQMARIARSGGWPARWARHVRMREEVERWVGGRSDVRFLAAEGARSPAVSSVMLAPGQDADRVVEALAGRGFQVGSALDRRHGAMVRIGHMGDLEPQHLAVLLDSFAEVLA